MVNVGGEKMSKSLGNFTTIRALLESGVSPMTLRLFVLQAHYRKPLDFTREALEAAATGWKGLNTALAVGNRHAERLGWTTGEAENDAPLSPELSALRQRFIAAMDDDLNTSAALGELFELARPLRALGNRLRIDAPSPEDRLLAPRWHLLIELAEVLGLKAESADPGQPKAGAPSARAMAAESQVPGAAAIDDLIEQRRAAKARKDFAEADRIRAALMEQGIELVDKPGGITTVRRRE
jgi:cysteinyl-tRNA synthetase